MKPSITEAVMDRPLALPHARRVGEHFTDGTQEIQVERERLGTRLGDRSRRFILPPLGIDRGGGGKTCERSKLETRTGQ
jgi:hypothetical protein